MNEKQKIIALMGVMTASYVAMKYAELNWKIGKVNDTVQKLVDIHNKSVIDEQFVGIVKNNYDGKY